MLKTTDGGATWSAEQLSIKLAANWIRAVAMSPSGTGLAAGSEGLVFRIDGAKLQRLDERPKSGSATTEAKS